jgi:hypothetical protein
MTMNGYTMFHEENILQAKLHKISTSFMLVLTAESCEGDDPVVISIERERFSDAINSLYTLRNHAEMYCTKRYLLCLYQHHLDGNMHKVGYCFR